MTSIASKSPFRLLLKSKSTGDNQNGKAKKNGSHPSSVHPLAGQQELLRQQYQKTIPVKYSVDEIDAEKVSPPDEGRLRNEERVIQDDEDDGIETMSMTNGWFAASLRDDESVLSGRSPSEFEFEGQSSLYASVQEIFQQQQQRDGIKSYEPDSIPSSDTQRTITATSDDNDKGIGSSSDRIARSSSSASSNQESGIFKRLKRISKRERISDMQESLEDDLDISYPHDENPRSPSSQSEKSSGLTANEVKDTISDPNVSVREAALEKLPKVERPRRSRIQSVQPSLVDDESIRELPSRPDSPEKYDEEDDDAVIERLKRQSIHSQYGVIEMDEEEAESEDFDEATDIPGSFFTDRSQNITDESTTDSSEFDELDEDDLIEIEPPLPREETLYEADESEAGEVLPTLSSSRGRGESVPTSGISGEDSDDEEEDEGAATPKAIAEDNQASYFEIPASSAPSITSANRSVYSMATASTSTPTKEVIPKIYDWYQSAKLTPQQRFYFLQHITIREVIWEYERLFMLTSSSKMTSPSSAAAMPATDVGYFKSQAKGTTPNLPLMRFIYSNILCTCPLFGPAQPIEGAAAIRARKAGAKAFVDEAILPLLRFRQTHCLASYVDLNAEWPGEVLDSPTITGVMIGSIIRLVARFFMRVTPDSNCQSWSWFLAPPPSSAAYLDHRVAPSKLKQGGMEVNIAGARLKSSSKECELLISIRKYGFPASYVVRTESDFYDYARRLAEEIGRRTRIRPVPPPPGQEVTGDPRDSWDGLDGKDEEEEPRKVSQRDIVFTPSSSSSRSSIRSFNSTKRPSQARVPSNESLGKMAKRNHSSTSFNSNSSSRLNETSPTNLGTSDKQNTGSSPSPRFFYRSKAASTSEENTSQSSSLGHASANTGSQGASTLVASEIAQVSAYPMEPPVAQDVEARRKQLRAWLRDVLSIRGAGHANETRQFLGNGSFLEKEVKSATRKDINKRADIDALSIKEREMSAVNAPDEIVELQKELDNLWKNCIEGDGLMEAFEAVKKHNTFGSLPLPYQRAISWANLQVAQFLHHVFLNSHESGENFTRATELMQCIPWKALSIALREPTGLMIQKIKANFTEKEMMKKFLAIYLGDAPIKKVDLEITSLKKRLGSTIMRKLQTYVESADWQKRVVQKASKRNNIPLVAAIVRGDDKPLLAAEGIKRIVAATKVYQEFINTQPSIEEKKAKIRANVEVRLIIDMQRALRLLCLRRDGEKIRAELVTTLKGPIQALFDPLFSLLKRLHRSRLLGKSSDDTGEALLPTLSREREDVIVQLRKFVFKLLDVLAGLKMRVQDPWRSLSTLTLFLDDVIPSWYRLLHRFAKMDGLLLDLVTWFKSILALLQKDSATSMDKVIAKYWQPPKGGLTNADLSSINEYTSIAKKERIHQMEAACRWAAGDIDADHSIQLIGEGGKTRVTPYRMTINQTISCKSQIALEVYLAGFRSAIGKFM